VTATSSSLNKHNYADEEEAEDSTITSKKQRVFGDDDSTSLEEEVSFEKEPAR
jgi:hypothetical protein